MVLDHCHASGKFRAYICWHCNIGLGHFKDNPKALRAAARYLDQHRKQIEESKDLHSIDVSEHSQTDFAGDLL